MDKYNNIEELLNLTGCDDKFNPSDQTWQIILRRISQSEIINNSVASLQRRFIILTAGAAVVLISLIAYAVIKLQFLANKKPSYDTVATVSKIEQGVLKCGDNSLNSTSNIKFNQQIISSDDTHAFLKTSFGAIRLDGENHLKFTNKTTMELTKGELMVNIDIPQPAGVFIKTPAAMVRATGTKFYIKATSEISILQVTEGVVDIYNESGSANVKAGFQTIARWNQSPLQPIPCDILPLGQLALFGKTVSDPIIQMETSKNSYTLGEALRLKFKIINTDERLWFESFISDGSYLLLQITSPRDKIFYTRLNVAKESIHSPVGLRQQNGWITFPKNAAYELECSVNEIFGEPGFYFLRAVYGATSVKLISPKVTVWQGLIESAPVRMEIKNKD